MALAFAIQEAHDAQWAGSRGSVPVESMRTAGHGSAVARVDSLLGTEVPQAGCDERARSATRARLVDDICRQRDYLKSVAMSLCGASQADADDLVQETLVRALARIDTLRDEDRLHPWVKRIMVNLVRDRFRRREPCTELDFEAPSRMETPEQIVERGEFFLQTRAAIQKLSPPLRQVVGLVCIADLSYTAAAEVLGVPIGTVMSRLFRARKLLKPLLEQHQAQATGSAIGHSQASAWSWEGGQPFSEIKTAFY